ncbi:MAG: class I SAM-dependent methyltransferase [Bosea sp. (in: a-proteobacteria)]
MDSREVGRYWEANAELWTRQARAGYDFYRDLLNTPVFMANLPAIAGLAGLDVGCGEGANTRLLARAGAAMTALDIAPSFIRHACAEEEREPLGISYCLGDATALPFADGRFDFATGFMSLMDMPQQGKALAEIARVLKPDGFLQFSILHPCFNPPHRKVLREADGTVRAIEVAGYFDGFDGAIDVWRFGGAPPAEKAAVAAFQVPRFHRTLSEWVAMIVEAPLMIEHMAEPSATLEAAVRQPYIADTRVAPLFLHIRARKRD